MKNKERVFVETLTNEQHEAHTLHTIGGNYGCAPTNHQIKDGLPLHNQRYRLTKQFLSPRTLLLSMLQAYQLSKK